jgi:Tfp pilus assembly protein PilF
MPLPIVRRLGFLLSLLQPFMCAFAVAAAPALPDAPYRAPSLPRADEEVLQEVPPASDPNMRAIRVRRAELAAEPRDLARAERLARAYIDFGRELGDAHYAGYAEAVIAPWLAQTSPPATALILQATVLQFRHEFAAARTLLAQALKADPRDAQGWLTLATLDMVQGDYARAASDCREVGRSGGFALGTACQGHLQSYLGRAREARALIAPLEGDAPELTPAFKAWVQGLLAEACERLGDWTCAEAHHRKALGYAPNDNFVLVAYADFLLDRGRAREVLDLLASRTQSDTAFLRLALAHAALGAADTGRYTWIMAARFEALKQRGSEYYGREQARFALHLQHDPQGALTLAQRNWEVQREPWDARVFLQAADAANDARAAAPVIAFLRQSKLQDPVIEPLVRKLEARASAGRER